MDSRLLKPSGRGRKPRSAGVHSTMTSSPADFGMHASMAGMAGFPGAASMMAAGFPKLPMGMPFANLAGLGMTNPMLGLAAAGFPLAGFPLPGMLGKEGDDGKDGGGSGSKDKAAANASSEASSSASPSSSTASPHPSFPGFFFNPMAFNPLLAGQLGNFPMANFSSLAHMAALNGLPDGGVAKEELLAAARKESKTEKAHSFSKSEKGRQDLTKIVEKIKDMSRMGASSSTSSSSSQKASSVGQDLTMKTLRDSSPSPAHSRGSRPSSASSASQDQATDLSIKARPSPALAPSTPTPTPAPAHTPSPVKSKNKIHKSFSLNKIVDSLKEKIEEKSKKKEDDTSRSEHRDLSGADLPATGDSDTLKGTDDLQPENLSKDTDQSKASAKVLQDSGPLEGSEEQVSAAPEVKQVSAAPEVKPTKPDVDTPATGSSEPDPAPSSPPSEEQESVKVEDEKDGGSGDKSS